MSSRVRSALITGVSRRAGIGAAIARELARDGVDVFITYYRSYDRETGLTADSEEPATLLEELGRLGRRAEGLEADLSDPRAAARVFDCAEAALGSISILINNAAYSTRDGIENITAEQLDRHYAVNLRATALLCAEFIRRFRARQLPGVQGRIVNLSSGQSLAPMPGELAYAATKGAVEAFSRTLSAEVAGLGVTVNAVDPGATDTGWMSPEFKAKWANQSPMRRVGLPEDAARLVRFLASAEAEWITGEVIHSRGGS